MPKRIQRQRTRGWKMPEGAVYVGRPTRWGNPFDYRDPSAEIVSDPRGAAVDMYRDWITRRPALFCVGLGPTVAEIRTELRGRDLCCWCRPDAPCHADVLLEIANSGPAPPPEAEGRPD